MIFFYGDILEYKNKETWVPIKNIGLHKQISVDKYMNKDNLFYHINLK